MKLLPSCVAAILLASGLSADEITVPEGWTRLTFDEPFDVLDASSEIGSGARWYTRTPWNGDFGDARFAGALQNGSFAVEDGILSIHLRQDVDGTWTSGLLSSMDPAGNGFAQQYGYFEMRARLPQGLGVWPAFWLIGAERLTPGSQVTAEIDVVEFYGALPNTFSAKWHVWHRDGSGRHDWDYARVAIAPGSLEEDFHIYAVSVTAETTTFYFDGQPHWSVPTPVEHRQPMMVLANLGAGGGWPVTSEADGAQMHIDYIRVYE